jgi:tetratricopeptide (TPR) repeat protein
MRFRTLFALPLLTALSANLIAQRPPTGGGSRPSTVASPSTPTVTTSPSPTMDTSRFYFLSGKVKVDDGTQLTDEPAIQSNCRGRIRTEVYTDSKGSFSIQVGGAREHELAGIAQASDSSPMQPQMGGSQRDVASQWRDCELQAVLPGFTSQVVQIAPHIHDFGNVDVGTIVLHRLEHVEGFTLSATTAAAPSKAKKEYQKGRELESKQKWDEAFGKFEKAVELYPKYAVAWLELGRVQRQKSDRTGARQSFHRALAADPKFIPPYQELAEMAVADRQWQELLATTGELLKLNPVSFPQYWFLNASASYYLQHLDAAEQSALKGLQVDTQHHVPKLEYLLGGILAQKSDYRGALEHIRQYLLLAPNAPDAEVARKQVQELERASAQVQNKQEQNK